MLDHVKAEERTTVSLKRRLINLAIRLHLIKRKNRHMSLTISKELRDLIRSHVLRKHYVSDLSSSEYNELVATYLRTSEPYVKSAIVADADYSTSLPDLIANFIESQSFKDAAKLIDGINRVFTYSNPAFSHEIQECFEDEWREFWPEKDEHFEADFRARGRDASSAQNDNSFK